MNKFIKKKQLMIDGWNDKVSITASGLYAVLGFFFITFLIGMTFFQNVDIYNVRSEKEYSEVQNIQRSEVTDEDTVLGVRREYRWTLEDVESGKSILAFYIVHHYVEVHFDNQLMYSLNLSKDNKIGRTTGNNWVIIPIYPEDEGKEVYVSITPVYKEVLDREVNFFIGSKFDVYFNQLKSDFPQIILSIIAIIVGILFILISIIYKYKVKESSSLIYLGVFSFTIGMWKINDIRSAPLMFTNNIMALSYISISMILLSVVPLLLTIKKQFFNKYNRLLEVMSIIYCVVAFLIIMAQITNIADLRETLYVVHISIAIDATLIVMIVIYEAKNSQVNKKTKTLYVCLLLCIIGAIIDMIVYYVQGHSAGILCTLIAFLIYIINMGYFSISDTNYRANIDMHTGLFNKSRCNEILDDNEVMKDLIGIIMFDLNHLKYTNDTFGHENGDILISEFAYILKENISSSNFIGRYGGDEFIVVIKEANEEKIQQLKEKIYNEVVRYNLKNNKIPMSYSMGYALTSDYPELTLRELLKKADEDMYRNKKEYHDKNLVNYI